VGHIGSSSIASIKPNAVLSQHDRRPRGYERPICRPIRRGALRHSQRPRRNQSHRQIGQLQPGIRRASPTGECGHIQALLQHTHPVCAPREWRTPGRGQPAACGCGSDGLGLDRGCTKLLEIATNYWKVGTAAAVIETICGSSAATVKDSYVGHARRDRIALCAAGRSSITAQHGVKSLDDKLSVGAGCRKRLRAASHARVLGTALQRQ